MSQHLSQSDIQNFLDRTISAAELLMVDTHLAECDECFRQMADVRRLTKAPVPLTGEIPPNDHMDGHLTYEQLSAYVDGESGEIDKEIVDVHKEVCSECAREIDDLLSLRATLQLDSVGASVGRSPRIGLWEAITARSFLRFAVPVTAAVLIGSIVWAIWFVPKSPPAEIVEVIDTTTSPPNVVDESNNLEPGVTGNSNAEPARPVVSLADGGTRIEIDEKGNLTGLNASQFDSRVRSALTTQNIDISLAEKELRARSGVLMGDGQPGVPFALTAPVGKVLLSDRPRFNWRPMNGAESYVVAIFDSNFNKVTESPLLRQPAWTPAVPLKRGGVYQWQVTASKEGQEIKSPVRPAPDARFKIVDVAAANDLAAAKRQQGNSHLVLGIAYASAGMLDEAEREFKALVNQNPRSDIAKRLLQKVRTAR